MNRYIVILKNEYLKEEKAEFKYWKIEEMLYLSLLFLSYIIQNNDKNLYTMTNVYKITI